MKESTEKLKDSFLNVSTSHRQELDMLSGNLHISTAATAEVELLNASNSSNTASLNVSSGLQGELNADLSAQELSFSAVLELFAWKSQIAYKDTFCFGDSCVNFNAEGTIYEGMRAGGKLKITPGSAKAGVFTGANGASAGLGISQLNDNKPQVFGEGELFLNGFGLGGRLEIGFAEKTKQISANAKNAQTQSMGIITQSRDFTDIYLASDKLLMGRRAAYFPNTTFSTTMTHSGDDFISSWSQNPSVDQLVHYYANPNASPIPYSYPKQQNASSAEAKKQSIFLNWLRNSGETAYSVIDTAAKDILDALETSPEKLKPGNTTLRLMDKLSEVQLKYQLKPEEVSLLGAACLAKKQASKPIAKRKAKQASELENPAALSQALAVFKQTIQADLRSNESTNELSIFWQDKEQQVADGLNQLASATPLANSNDVKTKEQALKEKHEKLKMVGEAASAIGGFCSDIAKLTGNPAAAVKFSAAGTSIATICEGIITYATNPVAAIFNIGRGVLSFFTGVFCKQEPSSEEIMQQNFQAVHSKLHVIHSDMLAGFNGLAAALSNHHRIVMGKLDHIHQDLLAGFCGMYEALRQHDENMTKGFAMVKTGFDNLAGQLNTISEQIHKTGEQLFEVMKKVHHSLIESIKQLDENTRQRFELLDLKNNFYHQQLFLMLARKQFTDTLHFDDIKRDLKHVIALLQNNQQRNAQDSAYQLVSQYEASRKQFNKKAFAEKKATLTDSLLTGDVWNAEFPPSSEHMLIRLQVALRHDPFCIINTLRTFLNSKSENMVYKNELVNFTLWQQVLKEDANSNSIELKNDAVFLAQGYHLLKFLHILAEPETLKLFFEAYLQQLNMPEKSLKTVISSYYRQKQLELKRREQELLKLRHASHLSKLSALPKTIQDYLAGYGSLSQPAQPLLLATHGEFKPASNVTVNYLSHEILFAIDQQASLIFPVPLNFLKHIPQTALKIETFLQLIHHQQEKPFIHYKADYDADTKYLNLKAYLQTANGSVILIAHATYPLAIEPADFSKWLMQNWQTLDQNFVYQALANETAITLEELLTACLCQWRRSINVEMDKDEKIQAELIDLYVAASWLQLAMHLPFSDFYEKAKLGLGLREEDVMFDTNNPSATQITPAQQRPLLLLSLDAILMQPTQWKQLMKKAIDKGLDMPSVLESYAEITRNLQQQCLAAITTHQLYVSYAELEAALEIVDSITALRLTDKQDFIQYYEAHAQAIPHNHYIELRRALCNSVILQDYPAALQHMQAALSHAPDAMPLYFQRACLALAQQNPEQALRDFSQVASRQHYLICFLQQAIYNNGNSLPKEQTAALKDQILLLKTSYLNMALHMADALAEMQLPALAAQFYQVVFEQAPTDVIRAKYAFNLEHLQTPIALQDAYRHYERLCEQAPDNGLYLEGLARTAARLNHKEQAYQLYRRLYEAEPHNIALQVKCIVHAQLFGHSDEKFYGKMQQLLETLYQQTQITLRELWECAQACFAYGRENLLKNYKKAAEDFITADPQTKAQQQRVVKDIATLIDNARAHITRDISPPRIRISFFKENTAANAANETTSNTNRSSVSMALPAQANFAESFITAAQRLTACNDSNDYQALLWQLKQQLESELQRLNAQADASVKFRK